MLIADDLSRRFGDRTAVDGVSFDVGRGEIFALLGPNGAGKTTTLRMLAGLIAPSSGRVRIDGTLLDRRNAPQMRARVGLLTETPGLWERLTVRQNLLTYARLYGLPSPQKAVDEALTLFAIRERGNDRAAQLSKGLKQRVALARTLLHQPDVVLLDEPTSGLDPESARGVRDMVLRLRDERRAILLSTHNLDEVERVADRVAVLRRTLVAVDTPSALRARLFGRRTRIAVRDDAVRLADAVRTAYSVDVRVDGSALSVAMDDGAAGRAIDTPAVVRLLVGLGAAVESVALETPSLEDVYLRLLQQNGRGQP
jgi:ABC-2 type transport system ATP-binding protein